MNSNTMNPGEYFRRALIYGGCGVLLGLRGDALAKLALGAPIGEQLTGLKLEDIIISLLKGNYNRSQLQQPPKNSLSLIPEIKSPFSNGAKEGKISVPVTAKCSEIATDSKWLEVIPHPSVVFTLGGKGSGKSALNHRLLELFKFRSMPFVLGMPQQALKDLPEWLGVVNSPDEVPENSTLLVDEVSLRYNARDSQRQMNREISRIITLSRQKLLTLLFVCQQARMSDKNIVSPADVLIIKEPEPLQVEFERREINKIIKVAVEEFYNIKDNRTKWSLVYSPARHFFGMLTNELPSYWSDRLSRVYALSGPDIVQKKARKMGKLDKAKKAKLLKSMGLQVTQIMREIGVRSRTTVYKYLATLDDSVQSD